jgi:hypothetical protein
MDASWIIGINNFYAIARFFFARPTNLFGVMSYTENKFDDYTDSELLNLWDKTKLNCLDRVYIYKELQKRNKLSLLDRFSLSKNNLSYFICARFKQGYLNQGGISSKIGTTWYVFFLVSIVLFSCITKSYYSYCISLSCINEDLSEKLLYFSFILLILFLFFLDLFMSSFILVTNKSIIFYRRFFLKFNLTIKEVLLSDISIINNIYHVFYLPFGNELSSTIIKFELFLFGKIFSKLSYILRCNLAFIFDEWIRALSTTNNCKCFMVSLDNFFSFMEDTAYKKYNFNSIEDYYCALKDTPKFMLFELIEFNNNFIYFFNYLNLLPIDQSDIVNKYSFLHNNELIVSIFPNKSGIGHCKSILLFTNERLIEITKNNIYLMSYCFSDVKLKFITSPFGISIYYKKICRYFIYWFDINIPLLDYIKSRRNYD